jgi:serine/threonine protein kinase
MHTDIKPENIVFVCADYQVLENPSKMSKYAEDLGSPEKPFWGDYKKLKSTEIRLVDFGSALSFKHDVLKKKGRIGTLEYSSPESILLMSWSFPSDVWSLGLTFADIWIRPTLLCRIDSFDCVSQILLRFETIFGPMPIS